MNNPAFESQQFADQVQARREGHIRDQGSIFAQGVQTTIGNYQQGQQHQMQMARAQQQMQLENMQVASELALNESRRQSAIEELQWARELHSTDMLKMQKDALEAETNLRIAQAKKAEESLSGRDEAFQFYEHDRDAALAAGMDMTFVNGRPTVIEADPEKRKAAQDRMDHKRFVAEAGKLDLVDLGMQGYTADFATRQIRPMTPAESETFKDRMRYRTPTSEVRNQTAETRRMEALLNINDDELLVARDALSDDKGNEKLQKRVAELEAERESYKKQLQAAGEVPQKDAIGKSGSTSAEDGPPPPPPAGASADAVRKYRWDALVWQLNQGLKEQANAAK
jgi:hypothetical protein